MNYRKIIDEGVKILKKNYISSANLDAQLLLSLSVKKPREEIILNSEIKMNLDQIKYFYDLIDRRKKREPISQIAGKKFFWKGEFNVNKSVLTPRFETELLVEEILKLYDSSSKINFIDIGSGSGCIIISLLKERKGWFGTGLDISKPTIQVAKINAKIQQVDNRIKFINSDIDKLYYGKYDLIVTNPPYINKIGYNNLDFGVKGYEPKLALYGGLDGLHIIEKVIKKSRLVLKNNNSLLAMEIGLGQHYKVLEILRKNRFYIVKTLRDYQRIKRFIFARKLSV